MDPAGGMNPQTFIASIKASAAMCKHPFLFTVEEMSRFLDATGFGDARPGFEQQQITGAHMTQLTLEQLVDNLNMSLGRAMDFSSGKQSFLAPGALTNVDKIRGRDVQNAQVHFFLFLSPKNPARLVLRSSCTTWFAFHDVL